MKRLTGFAKWLHLRRAFRWKYLRRLPLGFVAFLFKMMAREKLTLLGGRTWVSTNYAPFPSAAYDTILDDFVRLRAGEHRLLSFCVAVTSRCPMNCLYCSARTFGESPDLDAPRLKRLVGEAQDLGAFVVGFSGGEPVLRDDLPEIISAVDRRSVSMLFTSGWQFPLAARKLKDAGLDIVVVSLDSFDPEINNCRRGSQDALTIAADAARAAVEAGFYTALSMVPDESMLDSARLAAYLERADALGVHEVRILAPRPCVALAWGGWKAFGPAQFDRLRAMQSGFNRRRPFPAVMSLEHTESALNQGCHGGKTHCYVAASGDVAPCDFFPVSFGNIREKPLVEVYESMRAYFPRPASDCALQKLFAQLDESSLKNLPIRDPAALAALFQKLDRGEDPIPAFFRKLGVGGQT